MDSLGGGELSSALTRLDQSWEIQQRRGNPMQNRWVRLEIKNDDENDDENDDDNDQASVEEEVEEENKKDFVYCCKPWSGGGIPSVVLIFWGGAVLGQFPHIAYNELLVRLSDRLNAAVVAAPYSVGLDHFELAKTTGENLRRALLQCQQDDEPFVLPESVPIYGIAHSLGAKLATIYLGATTGMKLDGIAYLAYNNYGFGQTIGMVTEFANQIRQNSNSNDNDNTMDPMKQDFVQQVMGFAETAVGALGVEFSPSPQDTRRIVSWQYDDDNNNNNDDRKRSTKTRLFAFDEDGLDCSQEFVEDSSSNRPTTKSNNASKSGHVSVAGVPGNHLTPVYLRFGLEDLPSDAARIMVEQANTEGYQSASFGNEQHLETLVDEITAFCLGKDPSRPPQWQQEQQQDAPPRLLESNNNG